MFDRSAMGNVAIIAFISEQKGPRADTDCIEVCALAEAAGLQVNSVFPVVLREKHAKTLIGAGKLDELNHCVREAPANLVIFSHVLTPAQERDLEKALNCRVIDRTTLILDLFAQRAQSEQGRLQVELAQLRYLATRVVRGWTHLERQKGGIGLRGPGEKQLELDRRLLKARIQRLTQLLSHIRQRRQQAREARHRATVKVVSLVGYTNAGKSTLFNALTASETWVAAQLFATLDPLMRQLALPNGTQVVLVDTVGFIRQLPHQLIEAFRATLEESVHADLLLHVVDVSDPDYRTKMQTVEAVLRDIGAAEVPTLCVMNKVDAKGANGAEAAPGTEVETSLTASDELPPVWISAQLGTGLDQLKAALVKFFAKEAIQYTLRIPPNQGKLRASLYEAGGIVSESVSLETGDWNLVVSMEPWIWHRQCRRFARLPQLRC